MKTGPSAPRVWLNPVAVWELLDQLEISQNQLARLAGISPGHLSLLMNGKRSPAPAVRRRLMKAQGVDDLHRQFVMERPAAACGHVGRAFDPLRAEASPPCNSTTKTPALLSPEPSQSTPPLAKPPASLSPVRHTTARAAQPWEPNPSRCRASRRAPSSSWITTSTRRAGTSRNGSRARSAAAAAIYKDGTPQAEPEKGAGSWWAPLRSS